MASCGPVACSAQATGSVRIGGRTWRLRSVRGQIPAGRSARLRVASTKALRRAARATRRPLRVTVIVTVRGTDGKVATQRVVACRCACSGAASSWNKSVRVASSGA